jgi:hypothetical protein
VAQLVAPPAALKRTVLNDEHDPYLDFLDWVFGGGGETFPPLSPERRIAWMQHQLPQTYARLVMNRALPAGAVAGHARRSA